MPAVNTPLVKYKFFFTFIFLTHVVSAQTDTSTNSLLNVEQNCLTPFNKSSPFNNYAIKFKVLPWISTPSGSGINPSLGFEYGFSKNQSLGIDLYYNQYSFATEEVYDSITSQYNSGPRVSNRDKAIFLNYRYYFGLYKIREKSATAFYIGSFFRFGLLNFKFEEGYVNLSHITKENHYSVGILYGLSKQVACYKKKQLNIDTYIGIYLKQKVQFIEYLDAQNNLTSDIKYPINPGVRIGLTLSLIGTRSNSTK